MSKEVRYFRMQMNDADGTRIAEEMLKKDLITASVDYAGDAFNRLQQGDVILVHKGSYPLALVQVKYKQSKLDSNTFGVDYAVDILIDYQENPSTFTNVPYTGTFFQLKDKTKEIYKFVDNQYKQFLGGNKMEEYIALLKANHNIIFHGAPGTGKTYLAKQIADEMNAEVAFVQFHPSYDYTDFVEGLRPINEEGREIAFQRMDGVFKDFCKRAAQNIIESNKSAKEIKIEQKIDDFINSAIDNHTEYQTRGTGNKFLILGATDNSIKISIPDNAKVGELSLSLSSIRELLEKDKAKKQVSEIRTHYNRKHNRQEDSYIFAIINEIRKWKVQNDVSDSTVVSKIEKKDFVFIIDEINRGEISKIFGELFFSIDAGYRGEKGRVQTQYQNLVDEGDIFKNGFFVPENVYIIGTMNDIDRSVESMDFAMRRRFSFIEITAEESADNMGLSEEAKSKMTALNDTISNIEGLNSSYHIGASYFLKANSDEDFAELWKNNLSGSLKEYLRGTGNEGKIDELKKAYDSGKSNTNADNENN